MKIFEFNTPYGQFETHNQKPDIEMVELEQIHSADVMRLGEPNRPCDGIIAPLTNQMPIGIKTADCLAVLLIGPLEMTLLHAGWRGLAQGILVAEQLRQTRPTQAFIAPCISSKNYEVSEDFTQNFPNSDFFDQRDGKLYWSLEREACHQLRKQYEGILIRSSGLCTFDHPQLHSYRRDKTNQRNWNIFIPKPKKD